MAERVVTWAIVGAGSRGRTFAGFAEAHPRRARVVAVADVDAVRRETMGVRHAVSAQRRYGHWQELADGPRVCDAVILTLPDREHAEAAQQLAARGYAVLLEKPIALSARDCEETVTALERAGVVFAVAHVLRHSNYVRAMKQVLDSGALGRVVGVQHLEPVGWWHFAHSYVRGNWRREDAASFSLLTKCCHDFDLLRFLVGRPARRVSCTGGLHHFLARERPAGAADRCLDCPVEPDCPYSAVRLYLGSLGDPRRERWPVSVMASPVTEDAVRAALREGPYGRCVYACDNDVADHQVATIDFEGGATATLTMSAFTPFTTRRTQVMGTRGFLDGDGHTLRHTDFVTGQATAITPAGDGHDPHGGGDFGVANAFTRAVATGDGHDVITQAREALEGHLLAFAAEHSRRSGQPVDLPLR